MVEGLSVFTYCHQSVLQSYCSTSGMAWVEIILVLERQKLMCFTSDEKVRTVVPEKVFHPQGFSVWEYELNQKTVLKWMLKRYPITHGCFLASHLFSVLVMPLYLLFG